MCVYFKLVCEKRKASAASTTAPGNCSSVIAPALPYYRPSMDIWITLISCIHVTMHYSTIVLPVHRRCADNLHPYNDKLF